MDKKQRLLGEKALKDWANAKSKINDLQRQINLIKKNDFNIFFENFEDNKETLDTYNEILKELLFNMKKTMIQFKNVDDIINDLDSFEKKIIISRYQNKHSWEKIAIENHISRTNCFNIKNKIIKKILEI